MGQVIENVYASTLFSLALEEGKIEEMSEDIEALRDVFVNNVELRLLMESPMLHSTDKKRMFSDIFKSYLSKEISNFVMLLIDKKRFGFFLPIAEEFQRLYREHSNILKAECYTVFPLSKDELEEVREALKKLTSSEIELENKIDASLIGGIKTVIGDKIIDWSTVNRLKNLDASLRERAL